ncbi:nmrA-like family domain-containing protein 1 [Diadema antillarum]|uniref:nmrA-like family domain-containing protein 1 n=1 Tax=Diadema antillarum TaxID=105358 RepID=UPI003A8928CE
MSKLITVFGATGTQGGSVARGLLENKSFKVRGITRNVESAKAKALSEQGVEMVQASIEDVSSLEGALAGSYGVFAVTNYWEIFDQAREVQMGKNIVDAAKKVGVQHIVFSGLPAVKKLTGKACPHFDGKAEVDEYMFQSGLTATSVQYAAYMENFLAETNYTKLQSGGYLFNFPMQGTPLDLVYAGSAGAAVAAIFNDVEKFKGRVISLSGDKKTVAEYCDVVNKVLGPPVQVNPSPMSPEEFGKLGFPGADDLAAMFAFYQTEHPKYSVSETKTLDPKSKDFMAFVQDNKEKIRAILK